MKKNSNLIDFVFKLKTNMNEEENKKEQNQNGDSYFKIRNHNFMVKKTKRKLKRNPKQ